MPDILLAKFNSEYTDPSNAMKKKKIFLWHCLTKLNSYERYTELPWSHSKVIYSLCWAVELCEKHLPANLSLPAIYASALQERKS